MINGVNVVIRMVICLTSSTYRLHLQNDSLCNCPCELYKTIEYDKPYKHTVTLPKSLRRRTTLTRVGSDLDFDYNSCPPGSFMLESANRDATPLHDDCPMLFIIGARRAGTTSLYQYLSRHSHFRGIRVDKGPLAGETYHFTSRYKRESWATYKMHFPTYALSGEKSSGMLYTCEAPKWLYESCGRKTKVIVLLRNPTDRYVSAMGSKQLQQMLVEVLSDVETYNEAKQMEFHNLVSHDTNCINKFYTAENNLYIGFYSLHLANWLCNFPSENILVLNSEEFRKSPATIIPLVLDFLNLQPFNDYKLNIVVNVTYNDGKHHRDADYDDIQLLNEVYKKLNNAYRSYNSDLFKILHWNNASVDWAT